jgi:hypothetical protein
MRLVGSETFSLVRDGRGLYEREVAVDFSTRQYNMEEDPSLRQVFCFGTTDDFILPT